MTKNEFLNNIIEKINIVEEFNIVAKEQEGSKEKIYKNIKFKGFKFLEFYEETTSGAWCWAIYKAKSNKYIVLEEEFQGGYVSKYESYIKIFDNIEDVIKYMEKYYQLSFNSKLYELGFFEEV